MPHDAAISCQGLLFQESEHFAGEDSFEAAFDVSGGLMRRATETGRGGVRTTDRDGLRVSC